MVIREHGCAQANQFLIAVPHQQDEAMPISAVMTASLFVLLAFSAASGRMDEALEPEHDGTSLLAQAVPSNPGVAPGTGAAGPPSSGRGVGNPGVPPGGSQDQLRMQQDIRRQQQLRENSMARKEAAQMQRQAEIKQRYYLERDPLEAREAAREAQIWRERKDRLDKQRERLVQPE